MTPKQFFDELEQVQGFWIAGYVAIRRRGTHLCPICELARLKAHREKQTHRWFGNFDWRDAAEYLGLPMPFAQRVVNAADQLWSAPTSRGGTMLHYLRRRLLKALRLKEAGR